MPWMILLLSLACNKHDDSKPEDSGTPLPPTWDSPAATIDCASGTEAPLLETALADAGLDRETFGFSTDWWDAWSSILGDPYTLSWYRVTHDDPELAACFAGQVEADLDAAAAAPHPVAQALLALGSRADQRLDDEPVFTDLDLVGALEALVAASDGVNDPSGAADLPEDLARALVPIVVALTDVVIARADLDQTVKDEVGSEYLDWLYDYGAGSVVSVGGTVPNPGISEEWDWFADWYTNRRGPQRLADPARRLAFAIEDADLGRFAGLDASYALVTPRGDFIISPPTDETYEADQEPVLFQLELGGDDMYLGRAGATAERKNPVSVLVDLGGFDQYGYDIVSDPNDSDLTLPSDADGREEAWPGEFPSASMTNRQGSGRYGVGMLFDLGASNDTYASLRMSQGFGAIGIGVLYDDGGDDTYAAETAAQGSGVFGIGLLMDMGGDDSYRTWSFAQGFGYVGSAAALVDVGDGTDEYLSDPGSSYGGVTLYYSPQMPETANSSFTQGAGFGLRGDSWSTYGSGGLGVLRDGGGDDRYTAGVFAQGTGYWQGTGILADKAGNDTYNALWYVQAGAAHFAMAILSDGAGDDSFNPDITPINVMLGSGHDFSIGVFLNEEGDDRYNYTTLATGASNCQGIGVFADNDGSDTYIASSTYSTGLGNHSGECVSRQDWMSQGIFMEAGGDPDTYQWPEKGGVRTPADDSTFGIAWEGTPDEFGGAVDGDGETNFHGGY